MMTSLVLAGCKEPCRIILLALCFNVLPGAAGGQTAPSSSPADRPPPALASVWPQGVEVHRPLFTTEALRGLIQPGQRGPSRDPLKNGALIGAAVGAVALGAFGAFLCNLYQEEGGESCLPDTLRVAAIGAAIGAGAGLAVDAALTRDAGVVLGVGIRF